MASVSLIVPVYISSLELISIIENCLTSLRATAQIDELIIVDDGSPITPDSLEATPPDIFIRTLDNKGYTAAVNRGLQNASGDVLIVANDDLVFQPGWIEPFHGLGDGVIASLKTTDEPRQNNRFGSLWGMTRKTYQQLGELNEDMAHFYSDLDYYYRAINADVRVVKWDEPVIEHVGSATYSLVDKKVLRDKDAAVFKAIHGDENALD